MPAYIAVIFVTTVSAYIFLLPEDLIDYSKSVLFSSGFISNFYFWKSSGYFAASAHTKPLLHTWSLSVEEQFYIFVPILIYCIHRYTYSRRAHILIALITASFAVSVAAVFVAPTAGFFLLPTRAWELFTGVLLALWNIPAPNNRVTRNWMAAIGAGLIFTGLSVLTENDPFPGWYALLPCVGTALCIQAGSQLEHKTQLPWVNRLLAGKIFVWIGLISYSLYLIHWPIAAFANYILLRQPTPIEGCVMIAASIALSSLCWRYIEQPFRQIDRSKTRAVLAGSIGMIMAGCLIGAIGVGLNGLPSRFPDFAKQQILGVEDWGGVRCFNQDSTKPIPWDPVTCTRIHGTKGRILLWGDSFAAQYMPGIILDAERIDADVLQYTFAGCPPILSYFSYARVGCTPSNQRVLSIIREEKIDTVVISARWTDVSRRALSQLPDTVAALNKLGVRVYVFGQSPEFAMDVQQIDYFSGGRMKPGTFEWPVFFDKYFNKDLAEKATEAAFIDPLSYLCIMQNCAYRKDNDYYFADYGHFSRSGSLRAVKAYFPSGRISREP